jgi:predicted O-methyltransferase YrrM
MKITASLPLSCSAVLQELERQNAEDKSAGLPKEKRLRCISRTAAELLHLLVLTRQSTNVLEAGTSAGYSTIWLASAVASTGGKVTTIEADGAKVRMARRNLTNAGLADFVRFRQGEAMDIAASIDESFDFVLIDIGSNDYVSFFEAAGDKMKPGCLVFVDGWGTLENWDAQPSLLNYRRRLESDPNFRDLLVPLEKGYMISVKVH